MTTTSIDITISGQQIAVAMYRRGPIFDSAAQTTDQWPLSPDEIDQWPLSPDEIVRMVQAQYDAYQCRPTRDDLCWAIHKASDLWEGDDDGPWFFRPVWTAAEAREIWRAACDEAEDGLA